MILRVGRKWAAAMVIAVALLAACGEDGGSSRRWPGQAQSLRREGEGPPCRFVYDIPYHNIFTTCIEFVYDGIAPPEAAPEIMGLAFGPDGTLYMARTARGEIWAVRDEDGDQFMDDPFRVASDLDLPVALAVFEGSLYVSSVGGLLRLDDGDGDGVFEQQTLLVADLAAGTGYWPGSVAVGPDGRLYVGLGADCVACDPGTDPQPGRVMSFALDGSDARTEATGLAYPADFAWHPDTGELWIVDRARPAAAGEDGPPDELNRWTAGADYGFPACVGEREPDSRFGGDAEACASTEAPRLTFPHQSSPSGVAFYPYDAFPHWEGALIVALNGSRNRAEPAGFALVAVGFADGEPTGNVGQIAPAHTHGETISVPEYSLAGRGFYPFHPVDVVVSDEGWLYLSLQEGRILRFRPRPPE